MDDVKTMCYNAVEFGRFMEWLETTHPDTTLTEVEYIRLRNWFSGERKSGRSFVLKLLYGFECRNSIADSGEDSQESSE